MLRTSTRKGRAYERTEFYWALLIGALVLVGLLWSALAAYGHYRQTVPAAALSEPHSSAAR